MSASDWLKNSKNPAFGSDCFSLLCFSIETEKVLCILFYFSIYFLSVFLFFLSFYLSFILFFLSFFLSFCLFHTITLFFLLGLIFLIQVLFPPSLPLHCGPKWVHFETKVTHFSVPFCTGSACPISHYTRRAAITALWLGMGWPPYGCP